MLQRHQISDYGAKHIDFRYPGSVLTNRHQGILPSPCLSENPPAVDWDSSHLKKYCVDFWVEPPRRLVLEPSPFTRPRCWLPSRNLFATIFQESTEETRNSLYVRFQVRAIVIHGVKPVAKNRYSNVCDRP